MIGRVSLDHSTQQIADVLADPEYTRPELLELQRRGRYRTIMGAPMLVRGEAVGVLTVWRTVVQPFDDRDRAMLDGVRRPRERSSCATSSSCARSKRARPSSPDGSSSSRRFGGG